MISVSSAEDSRLPSELPDIPLPRPTTEIAVETEALLLIDTATVAANPHQPRKYFDTALLQELADSITQSGLIQPIVVRQVPGGYELVAGERRLQAAKLANLVKIPAIVRAVDAAQQAELALIENIHRADLNPLEKAQAYRGLIEQLGLTQDELSKRLSQERSTIANFLRLLDLGSAAKEALIAGTISMGHAKLLVGIVNLDQQATLVAKIIDQHLSVRSLESIFQNTPLPAKAAETKRATSAHISDLEKRLSRALEMRVQVRQARKGGKGSLVIHYASLDQFDNLLERLKFENE